MYTTEEGINLFDDVDDRHQAIAQCICASDLGWNLLEHIKTQRRFFILRLLISSTCPSLPILKPSLASFHRLIRSMWSPARGCMFSMAKEATASSTLEVGVSQPSFEGCCAASCSSLRSSSWGGLYIISLADGSVATRTS